MNYIKLTTNLPNSTNTYRVATYKIRQIRAISVRKTYSRMNYKVDHKSPESHEYIPGRNLNNSLDSCD